MKRKAIWAGVALGLLAGIGCGPTTPANVQWSCSCTLTCTDSYGNQTTSTQNQSACNSPSDAASAQTAAVNQCDSTGQQNCPGGYSCSCGCQATSSNC